LADPVPSPLAALAARAQSGDRKAFELLVHHTARLVYAHIVATVRDRQKAEDLTQDTFVAAWKGIGSLAIGPAAGRERNVGEGGEGRERDGTTGVGTASASDSNRVLAWLLTVARNTTLDAVKAEGRLKRGGGKPATDFLADPQSTGVTPVESAERAESVSHALSVLEELPEEYRRVLSMRYLAGADYETIRRALDLSDGALRGLLTRGMALMRERMGRDQVKG